MTIFWNAVRASCGSVLSPLSGLPDCQVGIFPKEMKAILSFFWRCTHCYCNAGRKRVGWSCLPCPSGLWPQTVHSRGVCPRGALSLNVRLAPCVHKISGPQRGMFTQLKSNSGGLSLPPRWGPSRSHLGRVIDPISDIAGLILGRRLGVGGAYTCRSPSGEGNYVWLSNLWWFSIDLVCPRVNMFQLRARREKRESGGGHK